MDTVRVSDVTTVAQDGWVTRSARVDGVRVVGGAPRLWFRVPEDWARWLTPDADPFLAAMLPGASRLGRPLVIEGEVSWRLLAQARQLMELWSWRDSRYRRVRVDAGSSSTRHDGTAVGCFFSAGLDSFYTLLKNHDLERATGRVTHLLCVLGYDLQHDNETMFDVVLGRVREIAAELGVEVIPVKTNLRAFTDLQAQWQWHQMGPGLAAVGLALGPLFHRILVPSGDTHLPSVLLAPSNALLDPLWSTDSTEFVHDGCEATRMQKVQWRIAGSKLALRHLRVCYENERAGASQAYNCGRCPKCVRTILSLHVAGVLQDCATFDGARATPEAIRSLAGDTDHSASYLEEVLALLREQEREPELQDALQFALRASRRFRVRLRDAWRQDFRRGWRRLFRR